MTTTDQNGRNTEGSPSVLVIGSPYYHPNKEAFTGKFLEILSNVAGSVRYIGSNAPDKEIDDVNATSVQFESADSIQSSLFKYIYSQIRAIVTFERIRPDTVIIRPQHLLLLAFYFRLRRVKFSVFAAQKQESTLLRRLSQWTFRVASYLIIESTDSFDWHGEINPNKVLDGRTYVDLERFTEIPVTTSEKTTVGYLGLLSDRKGIPYLIDAIKLLNTDHQDEYEFYFGGSGKYEEQLSALSGLYDNVTFLGFVPDEELAKFYSNLDILILPSESEGLPNVILESMACNTPALVTKVGGVPHLIADGVNGYILPNRSPETIAYRILKISRRNDLGEVANAASSSIRSNYSRRNAIERYNKIIRSLCSDG